MEIKTILLLIVTFLSIGLSLFIINGKKSKVNETFSLFVFSIALWAFGLASFYIVTDYGYLLRIAKFYYIAAAGIPLFFLHFTLFYPYENKLTNRVRLITIIPFLSLSLLILFRTNFLIIDVYFLDLIKTVRLNPSGYTLYTIYFIAYLGLAYLNLFRSHRVSINKDIISQLKFIIIGTIVSFLCAMYFNLLLPWKTYEYVWIGPLFAFIVIMTIFYAIIKHHLFDIKIISTEVLVFSLWIFLIIRSLLPSTLEDQIINISLLLITIIVGILLIRSVIKEVRTREKIESLAAALKVSNDNLAHANSRLKELDQLKSEFIGLATHQIRAPLTAIKGYVSLILEGDYGPVSDDVKKAMNIVMDSTNNLVTIVGDFLDISRIEQGKMKYDYSDFDIEKLTETVVEEYKPNFDRRGLKLNFTSEKDKNYFVHADIGKIKQVIGNVIDNSIKYTTAGSIDVSVTGSKGKTLIKVSDTGVGIPAATIPLLFQKFSRANNANKVNILGTGLGLYVAKQMVEAHHGRIWAESEGENKGAQFYIELDTIPVPSKIIDAHLKSNTLGISNHRVL